MRNQKRLLREAVEAQKMELLKARLDVAPVSLIWWGGEQPMAEELEL